MRRNSGCRVIRPTIRVLAVLRPPSYATRARSCRPAVASAYLKCYTALMGSGPRTAAESYLDRQLSDPSYASAYERASRRGAMFDDVVRSLEARRQELGITKAELARRADMPPTVIRRLFSQQHKNPTLTSLASIADALELKICVTPREPSARLSLTAAAQNPATATPSPSRAYGTRRRTA
jgi:DNA-binding phage protein